MKTYTSLTWHCSTSEQEVFAQNVLPFTEAGEANTRCLLPHISAPGSRYWKQFPPSLSFTIKFCTISILNKISSTFSNIMHFK